MTSNFFHSLRRDVLHLSGADRHSFLQGLISNDIGLCVPGQAIYAALLTPQGKFLHDMFVTALGDIFLIDCEAGRGADLLKRLLAHKLRAKIAVTDVSADYHVWATLSPADLNAGWVKDPRHDGFGYRAVLKKDQTPDGEITDDDTNYRRLLMSHAAPNGSADMDVGASTLQEGNIDLLNGISWSKGCYMGQELTARMHYRALVKKRLLPVRIEGTAPERGAVITYNNAEIGVMRSHAGNIGLACLNITSADEARMHSAALICGDSTLFVMPHLLGKV